MSSVTPDMQALKSQLRSTWMAGDFGQVAKLSAACAEEFASGLKITPGMKALDVACGTGNLAIPAARMGATVTGVDIAPNLLEQARLRAEGEGLNVQFDEGDAEQMPYPDASFDLVMSIFGVMFAPRPEKAASELLRVCRPGGRIAMGNWTPEGFIGRMQQMVTAYAPTPPGVPSPMLWGDEDTVRERFGKGISELNLAKRICTFNFPFDASGAVEFFRRYFGPAQRTFETLDEQKQVELRDDLVRLWSENNRATDGTMQIDAEYLEVIAVRA
jgi:SAM-dependent methyltransferase